MTDRAPIEVRTAPITGVDYPARIIEVLAAPYDEWAPVEIRGRVIEESFAPGSFGAVDKRAERRRFNVFLEHDKDQWVGRVAALYPNEPGGLRAELKIRPGDQFQQILDDAADGMYAASVGFAAAEYEPGQNRRRVTKAFLDHIALTMQPAYDGAQVLEVRHAVRSTTPNLDRILAERDGRAYDLA